MGLNKGLVLGVAASLVFISSGLILAEEDIEAVEQNIDSEAGQQEVVPDIKVESETQWLWGEVASVDAQNNTFIVKYLDYETDSEKEAKLNIDDKTTYENIKSLAELKALDTVSIDYIVSSDGKHIVKNISAEKPEVAPASIEKTAEKQPDVVGQPKAQEETKAAEKPVEEKTNTLPSQAPTQ